MSAVMCQKCGKREATSQWMGTGCSLCAARSGYKNLQWWCDLCTAEAQVAHLSEMAAKLPDAERRLKKLKRELVRGADGKCVECGAMKGHKMSCQSDPQIGDE